MGAAKIEDIVDDAIDAAVEACEREITAPLDAEECRTLARVFRRTAEKLEYRALAIERSKPS